MNRMKQTQRCAFRGLVPLTFFLVLTGCSREKESVPAPSASSTPPSAAETPAPVALTTEQAARLVRSHSPVLGAANAPVTIVEFLDPACEGCAAFSPVVKQILFVYPEDVRVVVRFAAFHQGSDEAIRLLEAARRQGKFEEMLTALFDRQSEWASHHAPDIQAAWRIAAEIGVNIDRAKRDAGAAAAGELLRVDGEDINALAVASTPTFYVNAKPLPTLGAQQLLNLVASEVARAKAKPQ
jgi:protein-disulfide isomerase